MGRRLTSIFGTLLRGMGLVWAACSPISLAQHATPEAFAPAAISSEVLGNPTVKTVANPEMSPGRVTIMPGGVLPIHYHPGTQIGDVDQGELSYSVFAGEIEWHRRVDPTAEPYVVGPGETVAVRAGDAFVESPESIHQGRNDGAVPLVIYLSTLSLAEAPRAIGVEAIPVP